MSFSFKFRQVKRITALGVVTLIMIFAVLSMGWSQVTDKEPVTISVVAANPSKVKTQTMPVKIDLPQEVKPEDILEKGELEVQYDDQRSIYFLFNKEISLKPLETRVFNILVRNVWVIPAAKTDELRSYTNMILGKLKSGEYYETGKKLADGIFEKLDSIVAKQKDETLGQKQRIGAYRVNMLAIDQIKEDIAKMEKILTFQGGPPVPEMLQESKVKSDAPSTKTTWLIIFSIIVFIALLGTQFFFTWHRRAAAEKSFSDQQKKKLPGASSAPPK